MKRYWIREGKPYFLDEVESGKFKIVIMIEEEGTQTLYEYDDADSLKLGIDVLEIPTRNLSIVTRIKSKGGQALKALIYEVQKFGEVCKCDYISVEFVGNRLGKIIGEESGFKIIEIKPRLFYDAFTVSKIKPKKEKPKKKIDMEIWSSKIRGRDRFGIQHIGIKEKNSKPSPILELDYK